MAQHRKSRLSSHLECQHQLAMPAEYFKDILLPQLCSLFEEDALKDTTIHLRASSISMSSFILSLLSPVLRTMMCGSFRECICKEINLDDVDAERLLKLLGWACGKERLMSEGIEELLGLGGLAERLQMTAVRIEVEDKILKKLRVENCLEIIERSEVSGLEGLRKECYKMLRDQFRVISQQEGFLMLSEETIAALLEEDELRASREEYVFEAVLRWMSNSDDGMRGARMLRKIRYGVMSNEYLAGHISSESLRGDGMVKELVEEVMAKKGGAGGKGMWDGVERLCDKWMVPRGMKGGLIGAGVLYFPRGLAIIGQGQIVVSDSDLHEIIIFNHDGSIARCFGSRGAAAGQFICPMGVLVDRQGHIIVADSGNHRIQVLNEDGSVARCIGSEGTAVGKFKHPCGVAIDRQGHVVVADRDNHRIQVFDEDWSLVRCFGSYGAAIGKLYAPTGVAVDGAGRIVVVESCNHRVQVFNGDGSVALYFGTCGDGPGHLKEPQGVAVDSEGRFVVADTRNERVQVFNPDGSVARIVSRVVGSPGDGVGEICRPYGVMVDGAGRIVVAEGPGNHRVQVL